VPAHAHLAQVDIYNIFNMQRLLWPGNSPDINIIEPAWFYLKRITTKTRPFKTCKEAIQAWTIAWEKLE